MFIDKLGGQGRQYFMDRQNPIDPRLTIYFGRLGFLSGVVTGDVGAFRIGI